MRHLFLTVSALTALAFAAGCSSGATNSAGTSAPAPADGASAESAIDSMNVQSTLMESARAYKFGGIEGSDSCYLTISATVEWPRQIGDARLTALTDTLVAAAFPSAGSRDIESAITASLTDTGGIIDEPARSIRPNEVPDTTPDAWSVATSVARTVLTEKFVTYKVTTMSYLGGAHPATVVTPVSYDLTAGAVVTPAYLFTAGSDSTVIATVTSNLAMKLGCTPSTLSQAGLLVDKLPMPTGMSLDEYGSIVFQYGQYEIAPYSMGIVTVEVSPYQLRDILTPAAKALLRH